MKINDSFLVRTDINAVVGEVNLLLRGKLKQFRGLCEANVVCKYTKIFVFFLMRIFARQNQVRANQFHLIVILKVFGI